MLLVMILVVFAVCSSLECDEGEHNYTNKLVSLLRPCLEVTN